MPEVAGRECSHRRRMNLAPKPATILQYLSLTGRGPTITRLDPPLVNVRPPPLSVEPRHPSAFQRPLGCPSIWLDVRHKSDSRRPLGANLKVRLLCASTATSTTDKMGTKV